MKYWFALTFSLVATACASVSAPTSPPEALPAPLSQQVEEMRVARNLQGLSVAVFNDYALTRVEQWGVKAGTEPVDGQTVFSTASIAKPVTALLCVLLEERGELDLDEPIARSLTRWSLPDSPLTRNTPPTWRHFLSHMAGTTQHGFADFYEGDAIPTLVDSLNGELPRYDEPISFVFEPGTAWQYSGGGYVIVQAALEDRFGEPLHVLAERLVFEPFGLENTTMIQPGEDGFPANAARAHDASGAVIGTGLPITPQVAASGLWSTPTDLARLMMTVQRALRGDEDLALSPNAAKTLTGIISIERSGGHTLSWYRSFGFGNIDWMRHDGSNTGVGGDILASMNGGFGMVMMANGDRPNRFPVFGLLRGGIIAAEGWARPVEGAQPVPPALLAAIVGEYRDFLYGEPIPTKIIDRDGEAYLASPIFTHFIGAEGSEMTYLGDATFKITDYPNLIRFDLDASGALVSLTTMRPNADVAPVTRPIGAFRPQE